MSVVIVGKIAGKVDTKNFSFIVDSPVKKFDYLQVPHADYGYVLCQIIELVKDSEKELAECVIIGYRDDRGRVCVPRKPHTPGTEVLIAEDDFIKSVIQISAKEKGAYMGMLEGKMIKTYLDINKILTKHLAVLAKSGAGKSYCVGALLEEIIEKKVPLLIIDPHGEYGMLRYANDKKSDLELMKLFEVKPKGYGNTIQEYGDTSINGELKPLKLSDKMESSDMMHILPSKLNSNQQALIFNAIRSLDSTKISFNQLISNLELEENNAKFALINMLDQLNKSSIFSSAHTAFNELIQSGKASVINLKGIEPQMQEIIVYKLVKDLFEQRKLGKIPPFFLVVEEAHNFVPERGFGETKSSKILRTIASEGRKFGLGLCVISQRPARIEKNVLSQCTSQIILKITNPNDIKAVMSSVEGVAAESEKEIVNLAIGSAMITGIVDMPLFVNIRPRRSKHGGEAVDILEADLESVNNKFFEKLEDFNSQEIMPVIKPNVTASDIKLMSDVKSVVTVLHPCMMFLCEEKNKEFNLLVDMVDGKVVVEFETFSTKFLPALDRLSADEVKVLEVCFHIKKISPEELISRKGFDLSVGQVLKSLDKKGYLRYDTLEKKYLLSDKYVLSNLSKFALNKKIEFVRATYDRKLPSKISLDDMKQKLSKFTTIIDQRECFGIRYEVKN